MEIVERDYPNEIVTHSNHLKNFAYSLTKSKEDAEDLSQDVMINAIMNLDKFDGRNLKGWLLTMLYRKFVNRYRRQQRVEFSELTSVHEAILTNYDSLQPDKIVIAKEIRDEIQSLPKEYSKPFIMHYMGYKYDEIADSMSLPIGTVKSRIHSARKKLHKTVSQCD